MTPRSRNQLRGRSPPSLTFTWVRAVNLVRAIFLYVSLPHVYNMSCASDFYSIPHPWEALRIMAGEMTESRMIHDEYARQPILAKVVRDVLQKVVMSKAIRHLLVQIIYEVEANTAISNVVSPPLPFELTPPPSDGTPKENKFENRMTTSWARPRRLGPG